MAESPQVGTTRMNSSQAAVRVGADGTVTNYGTTAYEQIYLGKRAASQRGLGGAGWYDRTESNVMAANRTARIRRNTKVRNGQIGYGANGQVARLSGSVPSRTYGSVMQTAKARSVSNNRLRIRTR